MVSGQSLLFPVMSLQHPMRVVSTLPPTDWERVTLSMAIIEGKTEDVDDGRAPGDCGKEVNGAAKRRRPNEMKIRR